MSQIIGISSIENYVVVDRNADIRAFYERKKAIRWGHISFPYVLESDNNAYKVMKMFAPEDKYVESLFSLHGLDFEEYKRRI